MKQNCSNSSIGVLGPFYFLFLGPSARIFAALTTTGGRKRPSQSSLLPLTNYFTGLGLFLSGNMLAYKHKS